MMEERLTEQRQIELTPGEAKLLDRLASACGMTTNEYLHQAILGQIRLAQGVAEDAREKGLSAEEAAERVTRALFPDSPGQLAPQILRLVGQALEKRAQEMESLEGRQRIAREMRALREQIRQRVGNIPHIEDLIDAGRDDV